MPRSNKALVALLDTLTEAARTGELTDVFIVTRACDDSYDSCYETDDLGDLLLHVRTEVIRAQQPVQLIEDAAEQQN